MCSALKVVRELCIKDNNHEDAPWSVFMHIEMVEETDYVGAMECNVMVPMREMVCIHSLLCKIMRMRWFVILHMMCLV